MAEEPTEETSHSTALIPIRERSVDFYGDQVLAVLVEVGSEQQVYVPLRPICEYLGLNWSGQYLRLKRDPVLSEIMKGVFVTQTPSGRRGGGPQETICLPLDYLNGWLFGVNATRVKEEIRDKLIRYQMECYRVLSRAFQTQALARQPAPPSTLGEIRAMGLAIAALAEQQMHLEAKQEATQQQMDEHQRRLDQAAVVVAEMRRQLTAHDRKLSGGAVITDEQAAEISAAVKALAQTLAEQDPSKNHYQSVFAELYRRFGVSGYKLVRHDQYQAVLSFLDEWRKTRSKP